MTVEDYMKLPKRRLAELLVEQEQIALPPYQQQPIPINPVITPCYSPNGICINPQMDCINCPRRGNYGTVTTINTKEEE